MKKRIKKRRFALIRPADALIPLVFLTGDLFGQSMIRGHVFAAWLAVKLFSLFTADSVRMAYATQPGMRQVKRSTTAAFLMQFVGAGAVLGLYSLVFHGITPFTVVIIGIGLMLNIEHVFYEYLAADGDRYSSNLCEILNAVLLITGIMVEKPGIPVITLSLSAAGCLITLLIAVVLSGYRIGKLNFAPIRHAPRAVLYGLAYPATIAAVVYSLRDMSAGSEIALKWSVYGLYIGFYAGLAMLRVVSTPFRRSRFESRTMVPVMSIVAVLSAAICVLSRMTELVPAYIAWAAGACSMCIAVAAVIALMLWGSIGREV